MLLGGLLAVFQLNMLLLWMIHKSTRTTASIPSGILGTIGAACIIPLLHFEHTRSVRPSTILSLYFLFSAFCELSMLRTLHLRGDPSSVVACCSVILLLKVALLLLEMWARKSSLRPQYQHLSPEETSGIINRSFLWWLLGLHWLANRGSIGLDDLYPLDYELSSDLLSEQIAFAWEHRTRSGGRFAFIKSTWRCLGSRFGRVIVPRLLQIGFTFLQPFLITRVLQELSRPDSSTARYTGYSLVLATSITYLGIAITTLHSNHNLFRCITMFRGATVSLIYKQSLLLDPASVQKSAAVSLMSTDVDRIAFCLESLNECWSRLIEIAIGILLLTRQLGWVSIMPLLVVLLSSVGSSIIAKTFGKRQQDWSAATEKRLAKTSSVLGAMKGVKMLGLSERMSDLLQQERIVELGYMKRYTWAVVWKNVVANASFLFAPAATFTVYVIQARLQGSGSLDTVKAFTSLALISLVSYPTARLLNAVPDVVASVGCFDRIQEFLISAEKTNFGHYGDDMSYTRHRDSRPAKPVQRLITTHISSSKDVMVQISNGTIAPSQTSDAILHGVNLHVMNGSIVMITGRIGTGKSVLLKSILGESVCTSGDINVMDGAIGYCAQDPWITHGSVRRNISGTDDRDCIDATWYDTCVEACALLPDISAMRAGDDTVVGSRGETLSGGQKHRIALARALYNRPKLFLLDNIFDAVDQTTESFLLRKLLGNHGLFKKHGFTVILTTHMVHHLELADSILALSSEGLAVQGTYKELTRQGALSQNSSDLVSQGSFENNVVGQDSDIHIKELPIVDEEVAEAKELKRSVNDVAVYKYYLQAVGLWKLSTFLFFVFLNVFSDFFSFFWLKWWSESGDHQPGLYATVYFLLGIGWCLGMGGYAWAIDVVIGPSTGRKLHQKLLRIILSAPMQFFATTELGDIVGRFSQDMSMIERQVALGLLTTVSNLFSTIAEGALIATGSYYMALTIPFTVLAIYLLQRIYLKTARQLRIIELETRSPVYSHFLETLEGLTTIRAFKWQSRELHENADRLDISQKPYYLMFCIQRWLALVLDLIVAGLATTVVFLALTLRYSTSPGLLGVSMNGLLSFNQTIAAFITGWTVLETSLGAIVRLRDLEDRVLPEAEAATPMIPPAEWPNHGLIELENVSASYDGPTPVLDGISCTIQPGQKFTLCGRTGSGKSSLMSTLLRILPVAEGSISIDSIPIDKVPLSTLRRRLITIPQDPVLLPGTVRLNLDPFHYQQDSEIIAALKKVGLWTLIEDRGGLDAEKENVTLSKGQQQLFAVARALVQRQAQSSAVVLLDEAMSSVDSNTERVMDTVLRDEFSMCTVICIAHRTETILGADVVAVLENGRVVELGSPEELMKKDGKLKALVGGTSKAQR